MKRLFNNIVSVVFTFFKFCLIKILHWRTFHFNVIERFSPNTGITYISGGRIVFKNKVRAHTGCRFRVIGNGLLEIGDNTTLNYGCMLTARKSIIIGSGVEFGPNVLLYDHDHDFRHKGGLKAQKYKDGIIEIGENSWIGANTIILKNVRLGKNCVVAAGSVLFNCSFPDNSIIYQKRNTEYNTYTLEK